MQLQVIMSRLLDVGSAVATPVDSSSQHKLAKVQFPAESTSQLEVRWHPYGMAGDQKAAEQCGVVLFLLLVAAGCAFSTYSPPSRQAGTAV